MPKRSLPPLRLPIRTHPHEPAFVVDSPPLTVLKPTGKYFTLNHGSCTWLIVEVNPHITASH